MMQNLKRYFLPCTLAFAALYLCAYFCFTYQAALTSADFENGSPCIVIDAGHGGEDGGTSSASGVMESQLNLEISLRLRDLLNFSGIHTKMIRDTDISIYSSGCRTLSEKKVSDLKNRTALVNQTPNAILVSIHQNYFSDGSCRGCQVFYAKYPGSEELATIVQQSLKEATKPDNHRKIKPSQSVYLMEHVTCPAVLVECGFLSNTEETKNLQNPTYQQHLASGICQALTMYLSEERNTNEV